MTTTTRLQCPFCDRWREDFEGTGSCEAFPAGIPLEVFLGELVHDEPLEGDHGVQFELTTDPRKLAAMVATR